MTALAPSATPWWRQRIATVILVLFAASVALAAVLHFAGYGWNEGARSGRLDQMGSSGTLSPSIFARLPANVADERVAAAVAETSSAARALEDLTPEEAQKRNAAIPSAKSVGPAAKPFRIALADSENYVQALDCMTAGIYYEAANEPLEGQRAVAQVVINRSRNLAYPHNICAVVYQGWERSTGCQFSFTCNGSLRRPPVPALWQRARRVAEMALAGLVYAPVGLATHYHADYVLPYWAPTLVKQVTIGRHIFYRWPGSWGTPRSFVAGYAGKEQNVRGDLMMAGTDMEADGMPGNVSAPTAVMPTSRPVLVAGALPKIADAPAPTPSFAPNKARETGRVYLMSRAKPVAETTATPSAPLKRKSVTGGVIMLGASLPQAAAPTAPEPKN